MTNPIVQVRSIDRLGEVYDALVFWCPGCERLDLDGEPSGGAHMLAITANVNPHWGFNGDLLAPTLSPSILSKSTWKGEETVCHSYMEAGSMRFLGDCTHRYKDQTIPLPPLPDWLVKEAS